MAHPNAELIERFYQAFQRLDGEAMAACYAPGDLPRPGLRRTAWARGGRYVAPADQPGAGLPPDYANVRADQNEGRAQWVAHYLFTQTGRRVENRIEAVSASPTV